MKNEVRISEPPKRRRGGQPGNRNRLRHGRYAKAAIERRKQVTTLARLGRHALVRIRMILRARRALKRKAPRGYNIGLTPSFSTVRRVAWSVPSGVVPATTFTSPKSRSSNSADWRSRKLVHCCANSR